MTIFFICSQLMGHPLIDLFHLSNLLQMTNDLRMVYVEFFNNFLHNCKRISFDDDSQLVIVNFQWLATVCLIFKALVFCSTLFEPPLHSVFGLLAILGPKCIGDVASYPCCFTLILNSNKKTAGISFLSNIISVVQNMSL